MEEPSRPWPTPDRGPSGADHSCCLRRPLGSTNDHGSTPRPLPQECCDDWAAAVFHRLRVFNPHNANRLYSMARALMQGSRSVPLVMLSVRSGSSTDSCLECHHFGAALLAQRLTEPTAECMCAGIACEDDCKTFVAITGSTEAVYRETALRILEAVYYTHDLERVRSIRLTFRCAVALSDSLANGREE